MTMDRYDVAAMVGLILVVSGLILAGFWLPLVLVTTGVGILSLAVSLAREKY